jgi:hypothetical protein
MTEKPTRRRLRALLVLLLGIGVAAWAVRSRLAERRPLHDRWQPLPPRPVVPGPTAPAVDPADPEPGPVAGAAVEPELPAAAAADPAAHGSDPPEPTAEQEPAGLVPTVARAVPAATAVASVTASALPDAPFGPGSARARADGASPDPAYVVKGKTATRVFYPPGTPYYGRTRADVWFRTADDARAAGFTLRVPRRSG